MLMRDGHVPESSQPPSYNPPKLLSRIRTIQTALQEIGGIREGVENKAAFFNIRFSTSQSGHNVENP